MMDGWDPDEIIYIVAMPKFVVKADVGHTFKKLKTNNGISARSL